MKLISISGLDGSGKSTQIEMLKTCLESQGKKVFYFHAIAFSIAQKISKTKTSGEAKSVTRANWFQIQLRKFALILDIIRFKSFRKKLEEKGFDYIVSDRYFYDSLINIAYLESKLSTFNFRLSNKMIPAPDFAFYLNADPKNIMGRDRVPDQGLEYLQKKKVLLDDFSKEKNLIVLDGNKDKEEIQEEIKTTLHIQQGLNQN